MAATARAVLVAVPAPADERPDLHLVERQRTLRPGLLGTVAVSGAFVALFVLAALQAVLVQGQLRLDRLHADVNRQEEARDRLALQINTLESPERLAAAAGQLGMVPAPDVVFLYAPLPGGSAPEVVPSAGSRPAATESAATDGAEPATVASDGGTDPGGAATADARGAADAEGAGSPDPVLTSPGGAGE